MAAAYEPKPPLQVLIVTGPHGKATELTIDGERVKGANGFTLHSDVEGATALTVTYANVQASVHAFVDVSEFQSENRIYRPVIISPKEEEED